MARVVDRFPTRISRGGAAKYPWDEWLDEQIWELSFRDDFPNVRNVSSVRSMVSTAADRRGKRAHVTIVDDKVYVRAYTDA